MYLWGGSGEDRTVPCSILNKEARYLYLDHVHLEFKPLVKGILGFVDYCIQCVDRILCTLWLSTPKNWGPHRIRHATVKVQSIWANQP